MPGGQGGHLGAGYRKTWGRGAKRTQILAMGGSTRELALAGDSYVEREQSLAFTALQSAHLTELLAASQQMPRTAWLRHVRAWAQASTHSPQA